MSSSEVLEDPAIVLTVEDPTAIAQATAQPVAAASPANRFFYGWCMLPMAMLLMVATSPGQTFGITYFNSKFRDAFDLSQTKLSATYLVATVIASLALPYIGGLIDRFGLRRSVLAAVIAMVAICLGASQVQGLATLFITFVLFRIVGPGTLVLLANNTLATWFDRRLGFASSLMQLSMAGAMAFIPAGIVQMIEALGWRGAYLGIATILAVGLLPLLAIAYRQSPAHLGQLPDGDPHPTLDSESKQIAPTVNQLGMTAKQAMRHPSYWILLVATATWALIGTGLVFHLDALFASYGLSKSISTRAITYMAIGMATAQVIGGVLADRIPLNWIVVTAIGLITLSCTLLGLQEIEILMPAFATFGCAQGLMSIIAGTAWARYFGRKHLGKIRGTSLTGAIAGSSLGPLLMGVSDDYLGSFLPALWLFAAFAACVAIAGFWATQPKHA